MLIVSVVVVAVLKAGSGWGGQVLVENVPAPASVRVFRPSAVPAGEADCFSGSWRFSRLALRDLACTDPRSMRELLRRAKAFRAPSPLRTLQTDGEGFFRVEGLPPGRYDLEVVTRDASLYQRVVVRSGTPLRLELEKTRLMQLDTVLQRVGEKPAWLIGLDVPYVHKLHPGAPRPSLLPPAQWVLLDDAVTWRVGYTARGLTEGGGLGQESKPVKLSGRVLIDGKPVPQAQVSVVADDVVQTGQTSTQGAFSFEISTGRSFLSAVVTAGQGSRCAVIESRLEANAAPLDLVLEPCPVSFRILDEQGKPVPNAFVNLRLRPSSRKLAAWADGRVSLPSSDDITEVEIRAPGYTRWARATLPNSDVVLRKRVTSSLELLTRDGRLLEPRFCDGHGYSTPRSANAPGRALVEVDAPGTRLNCRPDGEWPLTEVVFEGKELVATLPPLALISVPRELVIESIQGGKSTVFQPWTRTEAGPVSVFNCSDKRCSYALLSAEEGSNHFSLPPARAVEWNVSVLDAKGKPLPKQKVHLVGGEGGESQASTSDASGRAKVSSSAGWFLVGGEGLSPSWCRATTPCVVRQRPPTAEAKGRVLLKAKDELAIQDELSLPVRLMPGQAEPVKPGRHTWLLDGMDAVSFDASPSAMVTLSPKGGAKTRMTVTVRDDAGNPVAGALVLAGLSSFRSQLLDAEGALLSAQTDGTGVARLEGVRLGNIPVRVLAPDWAPALATPAENVEVKLVRPRTVTFRSESEAAGELRLSVTFPYSAPFESVRFPDRELSASSETKLELPPNASSTWSATFHPAYPAGAALWLPERPLEGPAVKVSLPTGKTTLIFPSFGTGALPMVLLGHAWTAKTVPSWKERSKLLRAVCVSQQGKTCVTAPLPPGPATVVMHVRDRGSFGEGAVSSERELVWPIEIQAEGAQVVVPTEKAEAAIER